MHLIQPIIAFKRSIKGQSNGLNTIFLQIQAQASISFSWVLPPATIRGRHQIGRGILVFLLQLERKGEDPGMSLSSSTVPHTSHHRCAIPDVLSVSSAEVTMTPNRFSDMPCLPVRNLTMSSLPESTCYKLHVYNIFNLRHANNHLGVYCKLSALHTTPSPCQMVYHPALIQGPASIAKCSRNTPGL